MVSRLFRERLRCKRGRVAALLTLLLGSTLSSPSAFAFGSHPPAAANTVGAMAADGGPEPALIRVFREIQNNRLDVALQYTEDLVRRYPNFRLGQLVKGDLLLARSQPLQTFGNAPGAPADRLSDLREEAIARLRAYTEKPAPNRVPRALLQMRPDQRFAVVVDTQKSRLYLYQNVQGRPRFVADYYITQGKLGAMKQVEGDKRTPLGVYHVTSSLSRKKLGDFYGSGAFPINYPNEWDRRQGRHGHGIWLHGTPSNTFSRPPKASDGCVVLANQDLDALAKNIQIGVTPVIITDTVEWLTPDAWAKERNSLMRQVDAWRSDWENRNLDRYLAHYSQDFKADGVTYATLPKQRRPEVTGHPWVKVRLTNLSMFRAPNTENYVVVTFDQDVRNESGATKIHKRQYWVREDGSWKILFEGNA